MRSALPWEQITLAARRGLHANDLPSNRELPNDVTQESLQRGWTVQQPYTHVISVVPLACVLCGSALDTRNWVAHECRVQRILGGFLWTPLT